MKQMDAQLRQYLAAGTVTVSRLLVNNYRKIGLSETELVLFLQLQEQFQFGQQEVDIDKIAQNMEIPSEKVFTLLYGMVEKKLLTIAPVEDTEGKKHDQYDFSQLYTELFKVLTAAERPELTTVKDDRRLSKVDVFNRFEVEFGRDFSPMEIQTIDGWLTEDHYQPDLILAALKEAVINSALSLRYIDQILMNWEKKNIKTAKAAADYLKKRHQAQSFAQPASPQSSAEKLPPIPLIHWSDDQGDKNAK
ncbi:MAG TPA: DnaD domain protein [Ligilactobacillus saerimneri]|nr:DnaD domain protein [Ligilactobacillus saerimneri]